MTPVKSLRIDALLFDQCRLFQRPRSATCLGNGRIRFNAVLNAQRSGSSNKRVSK
ncbi:hypothetical protein HanIR_Chr01g0027311 [Helianthus annuus]|nr:hypothetical protein HanIR_Chr01g0027311 [Helianthus annuus]